MTKSRRILLQISLTPVDHAAIREHCRHLDQPMAIWARAVLKKELENQSTISRPIDHDN